MFFWSTRCQSEYLKHSKLLVLARCKWKLAFYISPSEGAIVGCPFLEWFCLSFFFFSVYSDQDMDSRSCLNKQGLMNLLCSVAVRADSLRCDVSCDVMCYMDYWVDIPHRSCRNVLVLIIYLTTVAFIVAAPFYKYSKPHEFYLVLVGFYHCSKSICFRVSQETCFSLALMCRIKSIWWNWTKSRARTLKPSFQNVLIHSVPFKACWELKMHVEMTHVVPTQMDQINFYFC